MRIFAACYRNAKIHSRHARSPSSGALRFAVQTDRAGREFSPAPRDEISRLAGVLPLKREQTRVARRPFVLGRPEYPRRGRTIIYLVVRVITSCRRLRLLKHVSVNHPRRSLSPLRRVVSFPCRRKEDSERERGTSAATKDETTFPCLVLRSGGGERPPISFRKIS